MTSVFKKKYAENATPREIRLAALMCSIDNGLPIPPKVADMDVPWVRAHPSRIGTDYIFMAMKMFRDHRAVVMRLVEEVEEDQAAVV